MNDETQQFLNKLDQQLWDTADRLANTCRARQRGSSYVI
jgi:hypothetical protein